MSEQSKDAVSTVQRYDCYMDEDYWGDNYVSMVEDEEGNYVRYEDYEALLRENERLKSKSAASLWNHILENQ